MTQSHHAHGRGAPHITAEAVRRVFIITLFLNLVVAAAKGGYGFASGSIALGTDAVHALLDGSSNVLALLSLHWARTPADDRHPYGRQKIEIVAALGIGALIVMGLVELCVAAVQSFLGHNPPPHIGWGGFVVVTATMAINFFISRYEDQRGHDLASALLCADAQHTRSDLYASIAVLLSFVGVRLGWRFADPVGAVCVIILVGRAAWMVFRDNIPTLIDAAVLDPGRVATLAARDKQVKQVTRVRSRGLRHAVHLDVRIDVDPGMSVSEAHALSANVERTLRAEFPELSEVTIHAAPARETVADEKPPEKPPDEKPPGKKPDGSDGDPAKPAAS